jgi:Spy/CpxP family protein refolding chaperone
MSRIKYIVLVLIAGLVGAVWMGTASSQQGGPPGGPGPGGVDYRQRMLDRIKENLGATDEEWQAIQPRVEAVQALLRQVRPTMMGGRMFGRGGQPPAPPAGPGAPELTETEKATQALQAVLDNTQSKPEDIKQALTAYREARDKAKQELAKAQEELRKIVTPRQEARLVLLGLLE